MRATSTLIFFISFLSPLVSADLHTDGICVNNVGRANVYNDAATKAACASYLKRNTGDKQWDHCPDCGMKDASGLNVCHSDGQHIGGDELNYYCEQQGAGSMAN